MSRPFRLVHPIMAFLIGAAALTGVAAAQTNGTPERFTATAMNINNGSAGNIDITVNRWSSDADRDKLMKVLNEKGPEKLLDAVQDMPAVGHFGAPGNLSWDIHFARRVPLPDGGERVVLITDRRIGFWEAANQPRSIDYPFTMIELRLNSDGEGEGKLSVATKITSDPEHNIVTLENWDTTPVRLTTVKRERASRQ
jgi:hypothetical protein